MTTPFAAAHASRISPSAPPPRGRGPRLRRAELPVRAVACVMVTALLSFTSAYAVLPPGAPAPDFTIRAARDGKVFSFSLAEALSHGPVVLYFYPEAFTSGCTIEAHAFAAAADAFAAAGATLIGVSHDSVAKLQQFSVSECRRKFAVGSDSDRRVMKAYDSVLRDDPRRADRTSYVIAPDGEIVYSYTNMDSPVEHVKRTLAAACDWAAKHPR